MRLARARRSPDGHDAALANGAKRLSLAGGQAQPIRPAGGSRMTSGGSADFGSQVDFARLLAEQSEEQFVLAQPVQYGTVVLQERDHAIGRVVREPRVQ